MKIQCDVCEKEEATVFCSADEAALCHDCDRRVHCANKLAGKHPRYSLLHPTFKDSPLCDICQERRALLFCQEDRAILCRECDIPIHRANEHTQKHARFLLTGVKLSSSSSSSSTGGPWRQESSSSPKDPGDFANPAFDIDQTCRGREEEEENQAVVRGGVSMSASSISEYLMETLPGWRVDEFLDCQQHDHHHHHHNKNNNSSTSHGYCKSPDHTLPMPDYDFGSESSSTSSVSRDLPISVPQFFTQPHQYQELSPHNHDASQNQASFSDGAQASGKAWSTKSSWGRGNDNGFHGPKFSQGIDPFVL